MLVGVGRRRHEPRLDGVADAESAPDARAVEAGARRRTGRRRARTPGWPPGRPGSAPRPSYRRATRGRRTLARGEDHVEAAGTRSMAGLTGPGPQCDRAIQQSTVPDALARGTRRPGGSRSSDPARSAHDPLVGDHRRALAQVLGHRPADAGVGEDLDEVAQRAGASTTRTKWSRPNPSALAGRGVGHEPGAADSAVPRRRPGRAARRPARCDRAAARRCAVVDQPVDAQAAVVGDRSAEQVTRQRGGRGRRDDAPLAGEGIGEGGRPLGPTRLPGSSAKASCRSSTRRQATRPSGARGRAPQVVDRLQRATVLDQLVRLRSGSTSMSIVGMASSLGEARRELARAAPVDGEPVQRGVHLVVSGDLLPERSGASTASGAVGDLRLDRGPSRIGAESRAEVVELLLEAHHVDALDEVVPRPLQAVVVDRRPG